MSVKETNKLGRAPKLISRDHTAGPGLELNDHQQLPGSDPIGNIFNLLQITLQLVGLLSLNVLVGCATRESHLGFSNYYSNFLKIFTTYNIISVYIRAIQRLNPI